MKGASNDSIYKYIVYYKLMPSFPYLYSKELGIRLANSLLTLFDPTLIPETIPDSDKLKLIPLYKNPKVKCACYMSNICVCV